MKDEEKSIEDVKSKLEQLKKEIQSLSTELKQLGEQKETKYKEKERVELNLNSFIKKARELKDKKVEIDKNIKELKKNRETLNKEIKQMFSKFNQLKKKILGPQKVDKRRGKDSTTSPAEIKKQIEAIRYSIETEGLSFDREQKYMEHIKRLQQKLGEINAEEEKNKQLRDFKKEILTKKKNADSFHEEIQKFAKESTNIFKELTQLSKDISKSKEQKASLQIVLRNLKSEIDKLNQKLSEILKEWSSITTESIAEEAKESLAAVAARTEQVMEKLKTKKKLTKEDILLMQRSKIGKKSK